MPPLLKRVLLMQSASGGGCDGGGKGALVQDEKSGTLGTGNDQTIFAAIPINDKATRWQGGGESRNHDGSGNGLGIGKDGDPSPTLTAGDRHGVMCAGFKAGNGAKSGGIGYGEELSPTLQAASGTNQTPAVVVLDASHACDVIRECGEIVSALQARMGTGGNQVPLTYQKVTGTLSPGAHAGSYNGQDAWNDMLVCGVQCPDVAHSLRAQGNDPFREDAGTHLVQNMVVRRLTPLECERLQGYPDGWTDIGEWIDSKGKRHKDADSPRYKALGNSIALPFWEWMLRRMARYLPEGATLGSLFDGIGGFPLCWERIHGQGTARWASEIEQFPIAVTKIRFLAEE